MDTQLSDKFGVDIGDWVRTKKGCRKISKEQRERGDIVGRVIGWTRWRNYDAVTVRKLNGRTHIYLTKNLVAVPTIKIQPSEFEIQSLAE